MLRLALLAAVLMTAACSTTFYEETDDQIRLTFGAGGLIVSKQEEYERLRKTGKRIVIDGQMISADAFMAFAQKGACYTENARFSPHAISNLGIVPNYELTERYANMLPEKLEKWFKSQAAYYDWIGFPVVDYQQLLEIWPEGACARV